MVLFLLILKIDCVCSVLEELCTMSAFATLTKKQKQEAMEKEVVNKVAYFMTDVQRAQNVEDIQKALHYLQSFIDANQNDHEKSGLIREKLTKMCGYSIPTFDTLMKISRFLRGKRVVEVGAGEGLFESLVSVVLGKTSFASYDATDSKASCGDFAKVRQLDVVQAMAENEKSHVLVLIWPPYGEPMAQKALRAFKGTHVIYCGEGFGGCTGSDTFHKLLEDEWEEVYEGGAIQYHLGSFGLHDTWMVFRRKDNGDR